MALLLVKTWHNYGRFYSENKHFPSFSTPSLLFLLVLWVFVPCNEPLKMCRFLWVYVEKIVLCSVHIRYAKRVAYFHFGAVIKYLTGHAWEWLFVLVPLNVIILITYCCNRQKIMAAAESRKIVPRWIQIVSVYDCDTPQALCVCVVN